jgi:hypothetical protein
LRRMRAWPRRPAGSRKCARRWLLPSAPRGLRAGWCVPRPPTNRAQRGWQPCARSASGARPSTTALSARPSRRRSPSSSSVCGVLASLCPCRPESPQRPWRAEVQQDRAQAARARRRPRGGGATLQMQRQAAVLSLASSTVRAVLLLRHHPRRLPPAPLVLPADRPSRAPQRGAA